MPTAATMPAAGHLQTPKAYSADTPGAGGFGDDEDLLTMEEEAYLPDDLLEAAMQQKQQQKRSQSLM